MRHFSKGSKSYHFKPIEQLQHKDKLGVSNLVDM